MAGAAASIAGFLEHPDGPAMPMKYADAADSTESKGKEHRLRSTLPWCAN